MKINSGFIGNFKLGDNIVYNLEIINHLYSLYEKDSTKGKSLLRKPLIALISGVCEAILYDKFYKVKFFTREGVKRISDEVLTSLRNKKISKFNFYIVHSQKNSLLDSSYAPDVYDLLHHARKLRNRMHIQNVNRLLPLDEREGFTEDDLIRSEKQFYDRCCFCHHDECF